MLVEESKVSAIWRFDLTHIQVFHPRECWSLLEARMKFELSCRIPIRMQWGFVLSPFITYSVMLLVKWRLFTAVRDCAKLKFSDIYSNRWKVGRKLLFLYVERHLLIICQTILGYVTWCWKTVHVSFIFTRFVMHLFLLIWNTINNVYQNTVWLFVMLFHYIKKKYILVTKLIFEDIDIAKKIIILFSL